MHYTQLFRRLREEKGLSHEALARLARCHRNTVVNLESGRRRVKIETIVKLLEKMGYASTSSETASVALLWLESASGLDLADPASLKTTRQSVSSYQRAAGQAAQPLLEAIKQRRLTETQVRLLTFAARNPEVLAIIESVQDLLAAPKSDAVELKVAEDR